VGGRIPLTHTRKRWLAAMAQALCFNPDVFEEGQGSSSSSRPFDAAGFVFRAQKGGVALEVLLADLRRYVERLRQDLYDLINRDYAQFILLSAGLKGVDAAVSGLTEPALVLRNALRNLKEGVRSSGNELAATLQQRAELDRRRTGLKRAFRCLSSLETAERLLEIGGRTLEQPVPADESSLEDWGDFGEGQAAAGALPPLSSLFEGSLAERTTAYAGGREGGQLRASCSLLERVSHYTLMISAASATSGEGPELTSDVGALQEGMSQRASLVEAELRRRLRIAFAAVVAPLTTERANDVDIDALSACLRCFAALGCGQDAEQQFANEVMQPFIQDNFTQGRVDGGVRGSCGGLQSLFDSTLAHVLACSNVLKLSESMFSSLGPGEAGDEGVEAVSIDLVCNGVWRPLQVGLCSRIPTVFSAGMADDLHRNYSLSQDLLQRLAGVCGPDARPALWKRLTNHPFTAEFQARWNLPVYFQLRFRDITAGLESSMGEDAPPMSPAALAAGFELQPTGAAWCCLERCWAEDVFLEPLAHRFTRLSLQMMERYRQWARDGSGASSPEEAAQICWDAATLCQRLKLEIPSKVQARLVDEELQQLVLEAVDHGLSELVSELGILWESGVTAQVTSQCCNMLQAVKGITATYRMTNKPSPTAPSPFVPHILQPLRDYRQRWADRLPAGVPSALGWERRVMVSVTDRYHQATQELVSTVLQMEEALKKRKSTRTKRSSTSGPTDTEKIIMQLRLDADAFEADALQLGLERGACEPIHAMLAEIRLDASL
jgi:hypothetical protein